jgi:GTPase SAR1 family protein
MDLKNLPVDYSRMKLLIIGDMSVGKTALIDRFSQNTFRPFPPSTHGEFSNI